jgi:hypothetical protein
VIGRIVPHVSGDLLIWVELSVIFFHLRECLRHKIAQRERDAGGLDNVDCGVESRTRTARLLSDDEIAELRHGVLTRSRGAPSTLYST